MLVDVVQYSFLFGLKILEEFVLVFLIPVKHVVIKFDKRYKFPVSLHHQ